jgi:hypothetical protein
MTPLWFWEIERAQDEHGISVRAVGRADGTASVAAAGRCLDHLLEEDVKSLARKRANEKRQREAQLTDEQRKAIAEYEKRHSKPSKRQAEKDLGIPRGKIKWLGPRP